MNNIISCVVCNISKLRPYFYVIKELSCILHVISTKLSINFHYKAVNVRELSCPAEIWLCYTRLIEFVWQFFSWNSSLVNIPKFYLNVGMEFNFIANFVCSTTYIMSAMWSGIIWEMYVQNVLNTKFFMKCHKMNIRNIHTKIIFDL